MIIKTLRDAELALSNLRRELDNISQRATTSSGVTLEEVKALVRASQKTQTTIVREVASPFSVTDIDATPSEGQIIHRLIHLFYEEVRFAKPVRLSQGWYATDNGLQQWKVDTGFDNPFSGSDPNFQIRWIDSVTPTNNFGFFLDPTVGVFTDKSIVPLVTRIGDIGNTSLLWNKLWFGSDLNQIAESTIARIYSTFYGNTATSSNAQWFRRARGTEAAPLDVISTNKLGSIGFQAWRNSDWRETSSFEAYVTSLSGASAVAASIYWRTTNTSGTNDRRWNFNPDGHIIPYANNLYDVGASTERVKKLWAVDIDFSGVITGTFPTGDINSELNNNASSLLTLSTTFTDVPGASVNLDKDGTWLIVGTVVVNKDFNDDIIEAQLVYDSIAQSGIIRMGFDPAYELIATGTRSWVVTVIGQPKTAKLQGRKVSGTGSSFLDATNSNIVAVYLST